MGLPSQMTKSKVEPRLMNTANTTDECLLLYSIDEIKDFLELSYRLHGYSIKSVEMDGQKVFIIKFESCKECEEVLKESQMLSNASPTLLGCIPLDLVHIEDETLHSMRQYLQIFESVESVYHAPDTPRRNNTYHHPTER